MIAGKVSMSTNVSSPKAFARTLGPIEADAEAMQGAMTTVHAANICMWLKRDPKYDPVKEKSRTQATASSRRVR